MTPSMEPYRDEFFRTSRRIRVDHGVIARRQMLWREHVVDGDLVVPPGYFFAMGDNRDNSLDSRYWGFVPRERYPIGKPLVIFWYQQDAPTEDWVDYINIDSTSSIWPRHFPFTRTRWNRTLKLNVRGIPIQWQHEARIRSDPGRRPRDPLLAAQPARERETGSEILRRPHTDPADRRSPAPGASAGTYLDSDQRSFAEGNRPPACPEVPARVILSEPAQRNTAPAIGLAAHILQAIDPDAVMGVFPSDQVIGRPREYLRLVKPALKAAVEGKIVVLGIQPRWPETGYGYIEFAKGVKPSAQAVEVLSFREKPDAETAQRFVDSGNFYWNAGMFFWSTAVVLESLRKFLPKTATLLASLPAFGSRGFTARLAAAFPKCENISIDYAVLERASNVSGIAAGDIGWNDVGSWNAVHELHKRDAHGNSIRAEAIIESSTGNYVEAD